jgi:lipopolysaccharide transport system ATP-binding protein
MTEPIVQIANISKCYRIGAHKDPYLSLRETVVLKANHLVGLACRREHLQQKTEEFWALEDVSFSVNEGECVGIIGRNGAGKSTLLKILSQITPPTKGKITCRGRIASLLEVGTGFHPELTGRENIYLNGTILGMSRAEITTKFDEIIAFSEIEKFLDTPVKRYSSGMYVRLAFAVAAHLEPEILVVDEVLAVGDAAFQKKCLGKMSDVSKAGRTVLFVSHNMSAVKRLCQRCVWLADGSVNMVGETTDVATAYLQAGDNSGGTAEAYFDADEDKDFQLLSSRLLDRTGQVTRKFECDNPITLELSCIVRRRTPGMWGYMAISTIDGTDVVISDSYDAGINEIDNLAVGRYTLHITIPARSLGPNDYTILLNFTSRSSIKGFNIDSPGIVASFRVDDSTSKRGNRRGGYFSTLLPWNIYPGN